MRGYFLNVQKVQSVRLSDLGVGFPHKAARFITGGTMKTKLEQVLERYLKGREIAVWGTPTHFLLRALKPYKYHMAETVIRQSIMLLLQQMMKWMIF